jgi:Spy/CpxP family protein refolding chaperone
MLGRDWFRAGCLILLLGSSAGSMAQHSPYAGQQEREIKSLSPQEKDDLLAGRGMGLAKPAELNGYPGPMHVLELADRLGLTSEQHQAVQASFQRMRLAAKALGQSIIDAEHHLDRRFAHGHIDAASLAEQTAVIATLHGELRRTHLAAHLDMKAILSAEQITRYITARGYDTPGAGAHHHKH